MWEQTAAGASKSHGPTLIKGYVSNRKTPKKGGFPCWCSFDPNTKGHLQAEHKHRNKPIAYTRANKQTKPKPNQSNPIPPNKQTNKPNQPNKQTNNQPTKPNTQTSKHLLRLRMIDALRLRCICEGKQVTLPPTKHGREQPHFPRGNLSSFVGGRVAAFWPLPDPIARRVSNLGGEGWGGGDARSPTLWFI